MVSFSPFALLLVSAFAIAITALPTTVVPEEDFAEDLAIAHTDTPAQLPAELLSTSVHPTKVQQNEANTKTATKTHGRNPLHAIHKLVMKLPKQHRHFAKSLIQSHLAQMSTHMCDSCNEGEAEEEDQACAVCHSNSNFHQFAPTYPPPMAYPNPSYGYHNPSYLWHQHFAASAHHWHREQLERQAQDDREEKFKKAEKTRAKITTDLGTANENLANLKNNIDSTKKALIKDLTAAEEDRVAIQKELKETLTREHKATTANLKARLDLHGKYLKERLDDAKTLRDKIHAELDHLSKELESAKTHRDNLLTTITDNQLNVHKSLHQQINAAKTSIVETLLEALKAAGKAKIAAIVDSLQSRTEITDDGEEFKKKLESNIGNAIDKVCTDYESAVKGITCENDHTTFAIDQHHTDTYKNPFADTHAGAAPVTQLLMQLPRQHRSLAKSLIQTYHLSVLYTTCKTCEQDEFKNCAFLQKHFLHGSDNCGMLAHSHAYAAYTGPAHAAQLWHHHWHNAHQWNHRNRLSRKATRDRQNKFALAEEQREEIQKSLDEANKQVKEAKAAEALSKSELVFQLKNAKTRRTDIKTQLQATTKKLHLATKNALKDALRAHARVLGQKLVLARTELLNIRDKLKGLRTQLHEAREHRQNLAKRITENQATSHKGISEEIHSLKKTVINTFMRAITVEGDMEIQGIMSALKSEKTFPSLNRETFQKTLQKMLHKNVNQACIDYQDKVEGMKCEEGQPDIASEYKSVTSDLKEDENTKLKEESDAFDADTDKDVSRTPHAEDWHKTKKKSDEEATKAEAKAEAEASKPTGY